MKERPIIYSPAMVRARRDGLKTMTRRIIKPQPSAEVKAVSWDGHSQAWAALLAPCKSELINGNLRFSCPYGVPGDRLWPRENFTPYADEATKVCCQRDDKVDFGTPALPAVYKTDYVDKTNPLEVGGCEKWRPSIHMPRWASRGLDEITEIGAARVQDISEEDARAEGVTIPVSVNGNWLQEISGLYVPKYPTFREHFIPLWNSIHSKPKPAKRNPFTHLPELCKVAYPWEDVREVTLISGRKSSKWYGCKVYIIGNPMVWGIRFKIIK